MSCKPSDVLDVAKKLAELPISQTNDAVSRSIVSRAYYACLHTIDKTFPDAPIQDNDNVVHQSSHQQIIGRAQRHGQSLRAGRTEAAKVAKYITKLRKKRNTADYELDKNIDLDCASNALEEAQQICTWCLEVKIKISSPPSTS